MEVNGVNQSSAALLQQSVSTQRETQAAQSTPKPERPEPPKPVEARQVEAVEQPKPVVNTQGQTTGTRISTTA